jgi:hypothetical protein
MPHIDKFWNCFPLPPAQPAVGDSPQAYLAKLNQLCGLKLAWPRSHPTGKLTRIQLRNLCRDAKVHVLIAYAAVMAWGGRGVDSRNYRLSLSKRSRAYLIDILKQLRASRKNRQADFADMQQAAENIKGLKIAFYTKLLFFFREKSDAYILDQFTAKSANLLFDPCKVVLNTSDHPRTNNTPEAYEWFCAAAEALATSRTPPPAWTGEQVEQAMFDVHGGVWRKYLRSIYGKASSKKTQKSKTPPPKPPAPPHNAAGAAPAPGGGDSLPSRVANAHAVAYQAGTELPGANPQVNPPRPGQPLRVHCSLIDGVIWQYAFPQNSIHAEVFIPANHIASYDALRESLAVIGHDFGDGIQGNGAKKRKTRSIKLTIPRGLSAPQDQWDEIAQQAVAAMTTLFGRVCEII